MPSGKYMKVVDHIAFGKIIKGWANEPSTLPNTIKDFRGQVGNAIVAIGTGYDESAEINFVQIPPTLEKVSFVIPHKDDVNAPVPPGTYDLPPFYSELAFDNNPVTLAEADKEIFRSARIADYSAGKCM